MALTRKMLKAMGIEEDKIEQIIEAHSESVDALKDRADEYKQKLAELESVSDELEKLKKADVSDKYEKLKADFDKYKSDVEAKETKTAKENAVREFFKSKNITGKNLEIAMRGCKDEISAIELENGKIKETKSLDSLVSGDFAGLVAKTETQGINVATPPINAGGEKRTKDNLYEKDEKGRYKLSTSERQAALAESLANGESN